MTIDGNRKGADGGVYSTRLHDDDIPPRFFFNYLVTVVPSTFIRVNYIIRASIPLMFLEMMLQHRSRYENVEYK